MSLIIRRAKSLLGRSIRGYVDQCDAAGVSGWLAGNAGDERLQVEILADGVRVLRASADMYREDLATAGVGDGRHGFKVSLPRHLYDGREHTIELREASSGTRLPGSPKIFRATAAQAQVVRGSIDQCDAVVVRGWVANDPAGEPLTVEIVADGTPVLKILADIYREDLAIAGVGDGRHGFRFSLPENLYDGREHTIEIRESATGTSIPGSPRTFRAAAGEAGLLDSVRSGKPVIYFDRITGYSAHGWAVPGLDMQPEMFLGFGGTVLGKFVSSRERPDVRELLGLEKGNVGFVVMVGGLMQFSALSNKLNTLQFSECDSGQVLKEVYLPAHYAEAYTFAPLKSLSRPLDFPSPGVMRGARCFGNSCFSLVFEAGSEAINGSTRMHADFYQEDAGSLRAVGQFDIELAGQLTSLEFELLSIDRPVLIVLTDADRNLLVSDCIPCPDIFLQRYAPLVEYHCLLYSGQRFFDVAAKISRSFLDFHLSKALGEVHENAGQPHRGNTEVLLFVRGDFDAFPSLDADYYRHVSDSVSFLGGDGLVYRAAGTAPALGIQEWLAASGAEFFILCEITNSIRPDFWAVVHGHNDRLSSKPALIYWDSIWLEGVSRPYWVKSQLLLHEAFGRQVLAPINALILGKALLSRAADLHGANFRSGRLRPESAFHFVPSETTARLPVVMDVCRLGIPPEVQQRFMDEQSPEPSLDRLVVTDAPDRADGSTGKRLAAEQGKRNAGVSIVINYRNLPEATIRCLQSIKLQRVNAPIEIILVNNGSSLSSVKLVSDAARSLFGNTNVKAIDYNQRFNHSAQCNLAVGAASHEFILMLSNDAVLITADGISQALELASVPWVGTCGFRHVGARNNKPVLISMGLALTESKYLFSGSSPVVTNHLMPQFMLNYTVSTIGNTFAAVMIRKSVYEELHGLDEELFPHNYNDVDFCFRATARGYRHVVLGGCTVGHMGRGSREMDLDLPISERILERIPQLSVLADTFSIVNL